MPVKASAVFRPRPGPRSRGRAATFALWALAISGGAIASNLGALVLPAGLKRLYVARDRDTAGHGAFARLARRALALGATVRPLDPIGGDFNDDLVLLGTKVLRALLERQMAADDIAFLHVAHTTGACGNGRAC